MTQHYSIVVERETNGTFSAWVAGLPGVYAAADTSSAAKRGIRSALAAHLQTLTKQGQAAAPRADVAVIRVDSPGRTGRLRLRFVGLAALRGLRTSATKTEAARRHGRPRKALTT